MTLTGNILITGGSGTLGQAIIRTAEKERWDCQITVYSRSELRQAELRQRYPRVRTILGDVRDYDRLAAAVAGHDLVIHAAAMKRIPECEQNPTECYQTNVQGSANVVRACLSAGVARCIGISTDKACAAITTYGASKRMMEGLFQAAPRGGTVFTLVRYGNVLASNGSVIPIWRSQAAAGQPLTITDRRMTRFWMTERDAVYVIEQAYIIVDRLIVVPKMAALNVATMASYIAPHSDTVETGLRSTEKLHEDLVSPGELAKDHGAGYTLGTGDLGHAYTSDLAPPIDKLTFSTMLAESEVRE